MRKIFPQDNGYTLALSFVFISVLLIFFSIGKLHAFEEVNFVQEIRAGLIQPVDSAVSDTGDILVLDRKSSQVFVFDKEGKFKWSLAEKGDQDGQLLRPQSIALSQREEILIADTGNSRIQVFDLNGEFLYTLGEPGSDPGKFKTPVSVAVDQLGNILVADAGNKTISTFSPRGVFLKWKELDYKPTDMAIDREQNLYVLASDLGKIFKYPYAEDPALELTFHLDNRNILNEAVSLSVDLHGDIYLLEKQNNSILKFAQNDELLFSFGSEGNGRGQFAKAASIISDHEGQIYIADTDNQRLQVFAIQGRNKKTLKKAVYLPPIIDFDRSIFAEKHIVDINVDSEESLYALSDEQGYILHKGGTSRYLGDTEDKEIKLRNPKALYVTDEGQMIVADTGNHRLQFLNADGSFDYHFGSRGTKSGQFDGLQGIALNDKGYIYVADSQNNRIQIFNKDGIYLKSFGQKTEITDEYGPERGTFRTPLDLVFNSQGLLYVLDSKNRRIQVFDDQGTFVREIGGVKDAIQLKDPVDIDIDEQDFLYVADRGDHKIKIISTKDELVMEFGSSGQGPSYFPQLTSVAGSKGKIYVSDYKVNKIKVFNFSPLDKNKEERMYVTKVSKPLQMEKASSKIKYAMAKKLTMAELRKEFAKELSVSEKIIEKLIRIENEESLSQGRIRITASVPKQINSSMSSLVSRSSR